jgi:hypothetical protein
MPGPESDSRSIKERFAQLKGWVRGGRKPQSVGKDRFPVYAEDPLATHQEQLSSYLSQVSRQQLFTQIKPENWPTGRALLESAPEEKVQALRALMVRLMFWAEGEEERGVEAEGNILNFSELMQLVQANRTGTKPNIAKLEREEAEDPIAFRTLVVALMSDELPFTADDLATLVDFVAEENLVDPYYHLPSGSILSAVEAYASKAELKGPLRERLGRWRRAIQERCRPHKNERRGLERLNALLGGVQLEKLPMEAGEAWSNAALEALQALPTKQGQAWSNLLRYCQTAEASKPAKKWLKRAAELIEAVGRPEFKKQVPRWFELVALPRPIHEPPSSRWHPDPDQLITDKNSLILKGLAWCCAGWEDAELSRALSGLAEACFKKVRNLGPRCPRVGNACLYSLSSTSGDEAAAQLSRLDQKVKGHSAKKLIGKSLDKAAELSGQTREDLEESTVPKYGLNADGCVRQQLGNCTAEFRITGSDSTELVWHKAGGKRQHSVPSEVKEHHAEELKKLKRTLQDLEKMLPAQKTRIERLLMSERQWPLDKWRERYLNHPLLAHISRRLIWHFRLGDRTGLGIWREGKMVDVKDAPLDWLAPETQVRLWHPIGFDPETVLAWRKWLEQHEVAQPFKQAHREVNVITDAELRTGTYSNRFAAHIIKQHQFAALARQRGWRYALMGSFDFQSTPTLVLPHWGLTAEFFVEGAGGDGPEETAASGISLYLTTDQVRFLKNDGDEEQEGVELRDVPAVVFSEVMRDADLFVGVCSVGNDPQWQDSGAASGGDYWRQYSFGNLSATAATRKEVLERLIPRLRIASQCSFADRFLVVKGNLRAYKIHFGSGNILMLPNDQYLCIVPTREASSGWREKVFLPFEGDAMLSIILSKAFLLAEDDKIKDQTILNQIS